MLWTIFVILLVLWLLGVVTSYTLGGFIHVLLVVAVVLAIMQLSAGPASALGAAPRQQGGRRLGSEGPGSPPPYICPMFPYRDDNPTLATPVVTMLLIAVNVAVWILVQGMGSEPGARAIGVRAGADPRRVPGPGACRAPAFRSARTDLRARRRAALVSRRSPRCSSTAAGSTSSATCGSSGSSGTTSRTRWGTSGTWSSICCAAWRPPRPRRS